MSYYFDGEKPLLRTDFNLREGKTHYLFWFCKIFRGNHRFVTNLIQKSCNKKLTKKLYDTLSVIDSRPIRGEFKVWIYKSYLAPSIQFHLSVDKISVGVVKKIQCRVTSLLNKWLKIPRCATELTIPCNNFTNLTNARERESRRRTIFP